MTLLGLEDTNVEPARYIKCTELEDVLKTARYEAFIEGLS